MSEPIQECSIAEATWLRKWVIVNPFNISERMEFDSVHDLAQHLFNSKELILNMAKEREALQAEVERLTAELSNISGWGRGLESDLSHARVEISFLKAEVERLRASSFVTAVPIEQYERVIKAGSEMSAEMRLAWLERIRTNKEQREAWLKKVHQCLIDWEAAKEGKPSV